MDGSLMDLINFQSADAEVQGIGEETKGEVQQDIAPPIPAVSTERTTDDEPVPIKQWQLKQQKMLTEKDTAEKGAVEKLREGAKQELEKFYSQRATSLNDRMEKNREAEVQLIWQNSANLDPKPIVAQVTVDGEGWGRIYEAVKGSSPSVVEGTSRMKGLMALYASKADDPGDLDLSKLKLADKPQEGKGKGEGTTEDLLL